MKRLTFEEKQARLDSPKVKGLFFASHIDIETLGDVIFNLFFTGRTNMTYHKLHNGNLTAQSTGYARTVEDCYLVAKSYLPNVTYEQIHNAIALVSNTRSDKKDYKFKEIRLSKSWCCTVNRRVHSRVYCSLNVITFNKLLDTHNLNYHEKIQVN